MSPTSFFWQLAGGVRWWHVKKSHVSDPDHRVEMNTSGPDLPCQVCRRSLQLIHQERASLPGRAPGTIHKDLELHLVTNVTNADYRHLKVDVLN